MHVDRHGAPVAPTDRDFIVNAREDVPRLLAEPSLLRAGRP
jgi:hypothetical protein